jgi:hypothetical protein
VSILVQKSSSELLKNCHLLSIGSMGSIELLPKFTQKKQAKRQGLLQLSITLFIVTAFNKVTNDHNW